MSVRLSGPPRDAAGSRIDVPRLRRRAVRLLSALGHARSELSIALVDDATMSKLNGEWRGRPRATDVLSFSLLEGAHVACRGSLLGDVVIGVERAADQARQRHRALDEVAARLLIHGALHLLGHDHEAREQARRMRCEERRLWQVIRR